jgi:hypothetical protein
MKRIFLSTIAIAAFAMQPIIAQQVKTAPPSSEEQWPVAWIEIFKLAPGKHEEFVRFIAQSDEIGAIGGLPPTQLYFHENGAEFDVILLKPVINIQPTAEQEAAMERRSIELGVPTGGPAYFVRIRSFVASHSDTKTIGPISAAQWLSKLGHWRAQQREVEESR